MEINTQMQLYPQPQRKTADNHAGLTGPEAVKEAQKTVNLRDISPEDINLLITSGFSDLLDFVPLIPPQVIAAAKNNPQIISNYRVDYLGQIETAREFKRSIGEDTSALDLLLEKLNKIDGIPFPEKINSHV